MTEHKESPARPVGGEERKSLNFIESIIDDSYWRVGNGSVS